MYNRLDLGKRLKKLRRENGFSQQYVAETLFISQAAYSLIENSQNGIVAEHIVGLSNLYEVTTDFILKGDKMLIRISSSKGFIPFVHVKAHAGYIKNYSGNFLEEDYEWFRIPGYNPTIDHLLFEVEGTSMVPTVLPGDIVICQRQTNWNNILDGSLVLVCTKDALFIKRYHAVDEENVFEFLNENLEEPKISRFSKAEIKDILMIRGKISSVLVPYHQMASSGKIKSMEESIEFLKKELYLLSKKVNSERK